MMENGDWNKIVDRFWNQDNLQLLCKKPCHLEKTREDRKRMKLNKEKEDE